MSFYFDVYIGRNAVSSTATEATWEQVQSAISSPFSSYTNLLYGVPTAKMSWVVDSAAVDVVTTVGAFNEQNAKTMNAYLNFARCPFFYPAGSSYLGPFTGIGYGLRVPSVSSTTRYVLVIRCRRSGNLLVQLLDVYYNSGQSLNNFATYSRKVIWSGSGERLATVSTNNFPFGLVSGETSATTSTSAFCVLSSTSYGQVALVKGMQNALMRVRKLDAVSSGNANYTGLIRWLGVDSLTEVADDLHIVEGYEDRAFQLYRLNSPNWSGGQTYCGRINARYLTIDVSKLDPYYFYTPIVYREKSGNNVGYFQYTKGLEEVAWWAQDYHIELMKAYVSGTVFYAPNSVSRDTLTLIGNMRKLMSFETSTAVNPGDETQYYALTYANSPYYWVFEADASDPSVGLSLIRYGDGAFRLKASDAAVSLAPDASTSMARPVIGTAFGTSQVGFFLNNSPTYVKDKSGGYVDHSEFVVGVYETFLEDEGAGVNAIATRSYMRTTHFMDSALTTPTVVQPAETLAGWLDGAPASGGDDDDPYVPGGSSDTGGGGGNYDESSDPIPLPELPSISATDCGMVTVYLPTREELVSLAKFLWSNTFNIDTLKKLFADPMQLLIGLNILPISPASSGRRALKVGGFSSGVTMGYTQRQYIEVDCGHVAIEEFWGGALDYNPYTRVHLYLPHIGTVELNTDLIMNSDCRVVYRIDVVSGGCVAVLLSNGNAVGHWTGQCAANIPLTGADYSRVIASIIGVAGTAIGVGTAIGGAAVGASIASPVAEMFPTLGESVHNGLELMKGAAQYPGLVGSNSPGTMKSLGVAATAIGVGAGSLVSNVTSAKIAVQLSGQISGHVGILDVQKPYFIFIRPRQSLAEQYRHFVGYPSNLTRAVKDCAGFTQFESIELKGIVATDAEISEVMSIMKGGFYA